MWTCLSVTDPFEDNIQKINKKAQYIKNVLEYTLLKDIVTNCKIYYDPNKSSKISRIEEDIEI